MVTLVLPAQLASLAGGRRTLELEAHTVGELLSAIDAVAPMLRAQLLEPGGAFRQFVGFFVDDLQLFEPGDGSLPLCVGSQVVVVMAVAGG